jgi:hypothetical protein
MSTKELIENALLDAMGLLDEDETASFERAFRAADPAIQAHVRREQTRLAHIERLLPKVQPPADLKAAVLEAVRAAMEEERQSSPSPIFTLMPSSRVSPVWRAAAIGLTTAAIVFGATTLQMRDTIREINDEIAASGTLDQALATLGPRTRDLFFSESARNVAFRPVMTMDRPANTVLKVNRESGEGVFVCQGLPESLNDRLLELVLVDREGNEQVLVSFTYEGRFVAKQVDLVLDAESRLELRVIGRDELQKILDTSELGVTLGL